MPFYLHSELEGLDGCEHRREISPNTAGQRLDMDQYNRQMWPTRRTIILDIGPLTYHVNLAMIAQNMKNVTTVFIGLFIPFTFNCLESHAFDTGISSMVRIEENIFLVVNDRKNSYKEDRILANTKPRFGIVTVKKKWVAFEDLYVKYPLGMSDMPPSDLEAICALPDRKQEFLVAESGYFEGKYGRVFHMRLKEKKGKWKGEFLSVFRPFSDNESAYTTPKSKQIEGIACIEMNENSAYDYLCHSWRRWREGKIHLGIARRTR